MMLLLPQLTWMIMIGAPRQNPPVNLKHSDTNTPPLVPYNTQNDQKLVE
jgi:hypothetical protein